MCVGAECFPFAASGGKPNHAPLQSVPSGFGSVSHPDLYPGTLGRPCGLSKALFLFSKKVSYSWELVGLPRSSSAVNLQTEEQRHHLHP